MSKLKQKFIHVLFSVLLLTILAGCWSSQELNDISIITGLGIDKQDGQYLLTAQIINPGQIATKEGADPSRTEVTTYNVVGKTLFEGIRRLTKKIPKKIYNSHLRIVIIGEELAREGISKELDFLSRDHEFRSDFYMIIAKDTTANSILDIEVPMEKIPAEKIYSSLKTSHTNFATTVPVKLDKLINDLISKGINPVLTGIRILGDPESGRFKSNVDHIPAPTLLENSDTAAFKKDKLVGWLNESESQAYNFITNNVINTVIDIACPNDEDGDITLELTDSKTKIKGNVNNNEPNIKVIIQAEGNVGEFTCGSDLVNKKTFDQLEKLAEHKIKSDIRSTIEKAQADFKSDIFGFGEVIHRADPKAWKRLQKNWNQQFAALHPDIKVKFKIRETGTIGNSFLKKMEE